MDIALKNEDGIFKLRVCGALKVGEKFLLIKHEDSNFFCLPGGHVEHGEDSETAAKREMEEELGFPVKLEKLLGIDQNFFPLSNGKSFHEIAFYYLFSPVEEISVCDFEREENDKGKLKHHLFRWLSLEELEKEDVRPKIIKKILENSAFPILSISKE